MRYSYFREDASSNATVFQSDVETTYVSIIWIVFNNVPSGFKARNCSSKWKKAAVSVWVETNDNQKNTLIVPVPSRKATTGCAAKNNNIAKGEDKPGKCLWYYLVCSFRLPPLAGCVVFFFLTSRMQLHSDIITASTIFDIKHWRPIWAAGNAALFK